MTDDTDNGWKLYKVSDFAEVVGGGTPSTKDQTNFGEDIPWITPKDLSTHQSRYIARGERSLSTRGLAGSSAKRLPAGTVLVSSRAPIGLTAIAQNEVSTNQGCRSLVLNASIADSEFVYYLMTASTDYLHQHANGTTFMELSGGVFKSLEFMLPRLDEQRRIAEVLGALDDRIDVLRRLQSLLQDEARALLALALADGAVEVKLEDIAEVVMGNSPPGSSYNTDGIGTPLFQGCAEFGFRYPSERLYTTQPSRMAAPDDTLVSVRAPVGKLNRASGVCCIGRGLAAVRSAAYPSLVHYALDASEGVWDPYNSEGTVFGSINGGSMRGLNLTWPADPDVIERQLRGIDDAIKRFAVEETELASARAVLLPALVSGELRVAAAEELVEAAT